MMWLFLACQDSGSLDANKSDDLDTDEALDDTGDDDDDDDDDDDTDDTDTDPPGLAPDYAMVGSASVAVSEITFSASCTMAVTLFEPDSAPVGTVVLSHGFMRSRAQVEGLARHYASWGLAVATPALCHASIFDTDHAANGSELAALGASLPGDVLYVGHSAGGLASVLAATHDADALGVFGLDPVDSGGEGAAATVDVDVFGLLGEPSSCNSGSNGAALLDAGVRITGADHCDFEMPTDAGCSLFCNGNGPFSEEAVTDAILGLSTAWLLWRSGAEPAAEQWWTPGEERFDDLATPGLVTPL